MLERHHSKSKAMLQDLGFTEEDERWAVEICKMSQIVNIGLESFNVPADAGELGAFFRKNLLRIMWRLN